METYLVPTRTTRRQVKHVDDDGRQSIDTYVLKKEEGEGMEDHWNTPDNVYVYEITNLGNRRILLSQYKPVLTC